MSTSATDAPCRHCGGPVPIVLAGPDPRCDYCQTPEPLEASLAERVKRLRQQISAMASRQQRMVTLQAEAADMYAGWLTTWGAFLTLCLYALVPALAVGTIPEGVGVIDFYFRGEGVVDGELLARWWFFWSFFTTIAALIFLQRTYATIRALQLTPTVLPRPPRAPGEPATCRVCGGPLAGQGRVQPCNYCGATHLVTGRYLDDHAETVEDRLQTYERQATRLAKQSEATSLGLWVGTMTFSFAGPSVAVAVGYFALDGVRPQLWGVTAIAIVLAAIATGSSRRFSFPEVPHPRDIGVGDLIVVRGEYRRVAARLGAWNSTLFVFDDHARGLLVKYVIDEGWTATTVGITTGGPPLTPKELDAEGMESGLIPTNVSASDGSLLPVGPIYTHAGPAAHELRVWNARPSAGTNATLTLSKGSKLHHREFLLAGPP